MQNLNKNSQAVPAAPHAEDLANFRQLKANDMEYNTSQKFAGNEIRTTKYTLLTFLPKNLFEQFSRAANLYFLVIAILQFIPGVSPISWWSSVLPLIFVLSVTAVKEAVEDYRRAQMDAQVNARSVQVLRGSELETIEWKDLAVGDIVMVRKGQQFPADIMFFASSDVSHICYIETMNLDGETNLKVKDALDATCKLRTPAEFAQLRSSVICEKPNNSLYTFDGKIVIEGFDQPFSVSVRNILLRGCTLRNTDWICGLAIFTGHDTKLMQNSNDPPSKRSQVERKMNRMIFILFGILTFFCIMCAFANGMFADFVVPKMFYLTGGMSVAGGAAFSVLSFLVLYNIMIPISLYVSLELVKVFHALLINLDSAMYHEDSDTPARARTSNLGEELGQIDYIFSDKTGTLTCNVMEFLKCSIAGTAFGTGSTEVGRAAARRLGKPLPEDKRPPGMRFEKGFNFYDPRVTSGAWCTQPNAGVFREFLTLLAVCHTVIPEGDPKTPEKMIYQAASPDEAALVAAAKNLGFYFHTRTPHSVFVRVNPRDYYFDNPSMRTREGFMDLEFKILQVLEFDSTRKRMSVLCRCPDGKIRLYCKGADTVIYERLHSQSAFRTESQRDLEQFADEGLRTLCLAVTEIEESAYTLWAEEYYRASVSLDGREDKINACGEKIERNLHLLGSTAIEDKLQAGVPDCIANLARAGIKIWVLTGDKQETAINIGFACALLNTEMDVLIVNEPSVAAVTACLQRYLATIESGQGARERGLVIDGHSLAFTIGTSSSAKRVDAAANKELDPDVKVARDLFLKVSAYCKSVICCRVSPLQKSLVVQLVKDNVKGTVTLAIGDGANDVPMIQAAHVGVGISGQEGMQAVMSSDYAIAQFRFLQRLLVVHGRWNFVRIAKLVCYSFYKNMAFALVQFWFQCFSLFSANTLLDSWHITFYNVIFTSLPIMFLAVLDQDVPASISMANPELYYTSQRGDAFSFKNFFIWLLEGFYHSACIFFIPAAIYGLANNGASTQANGLDTGFIWGIGTIVYTILCMTVNLRLLMTSSFITRWNSLIIVLTILSWWAFDLMYNAFPVSFLESLNAVQQFHLIFEIAGTAVFWLTVLLTCVVCMIPSFVLKYLSLHWSAMPDIAYILRRLYLAGTIKADESIVKMQDGVVVRDSAASQAAGGPETKGLDGQMAARNRFRAAVHAVHGTTYLHNKARGAHMGFAFSQERGNALFPLSARENSRAPPTTPGARPASANARASVSSPGQPRQNIDVGRPPSAGGSART
eukprot:ANDGO_03252.mRNA.1 Phospholipid-transporting ATPase 3